MKTILVYTLVSTNKDIYLEQAALSAYSVKKYSPNITVCLVVDNKTDSLINGNRNILLEYIDKKVVVNLSDEYTNAEKSRILKTNLRNYIEGPYLFVDTDTIICSPLDKIDSLLDKGISLAAVKDGHTSFKDMYYYDIQIERSRLIGWDLTNDSIHFNSGVMFVADDELARRFYKKWHENWLYERSKGVYYDQLALAHTNEQFGYPIHILDNIWNCQIEVNGMKFISNAKIIHLFGGYLDGNGYYFKNKKPYLFIKEHGEFDEETLYYLENPKSSFIGHMTYLGNDEYYIRHSPLFTLFKYHKREYYQMEKIANLYMKYREKLKKYFK